MQELKALLEKQNSDWEEFKKTNDIRIKSLEDRKTVDPLIDEKLAKLNADLSKTSEQLAGIEAKMNRPRFGGGKTDERQEVAEHKAAFGGFLRKGHETGLRDLEAKAMQVAVDADGGYLVPEEIDRNILELERNESPMRRLANVIQVGSDKYSRVVSLGGAASGWVGETDPRPETATPKIAEIAAFMGEIYANPAVTQRLLDDAIVDVEAWLAAEVAYEFSRQENIAFLTGNGVNKPKGILAYTSVVTPDDTRAFGQLQHKVAASATEVTADELLDLVYMLKSGYRTGAAYMANSAAISALRKLKTTDGAYIWSPSIQTGQPATLWGYPLETNEDMAVPAAGAAAVIFGNFKRGYTIADRFGIRVLRDPYTNKPYVHFYTTKRVGGMVTDSNALKILQMGA